MNVVALAGALRATRGFAHKRDISGVLQRLQPALAADIAVGDDCAAIADGDGWLLFAIEGLVDEFVARMPWFAGYCGVMVNVSDIFAMGGRPIAVVDALWGEAEGESTSGAVLAGMTEASRRYGVPIVGGHSNQKARQPQLAVAILGRARRLLTSFDARPGDQLVAAIDLRGSWEEPYPYWNASTPAPAERLRGDLEVLPGLAEDGLCAAAKDVSMAGVVGTALMLLESSGVGARIDIDAIPRPATVQGDAALLRWLSAFPSFGFVLSVDPAQVAAVGSRFAARDIAWAPIGEVTAGAEVMLHHEGAEASLWNFAENPFIAARPRARVSEEVALA